MFFLERNKKSGKKAKKTLKCFKLRASSFLSSFLFFVLLTKKTGGPLLLMELAFLLRGVGAEVVWITSQKPPESDEVIYSLENKMLDRGVQVPSLTSCSIL